MRVKTVSRKTSSWHILLDGISGISRKHERARKKVFISYAWPDSDKKHPKTVKLHRWLEHLKENLLCAGMKEVFLDVHSMSGNFKETMLRELTESDFVIPILTPQFLERAHNKETNLAFEFEQTLIKAQANPASIVPILLEGSFQDVVKDELAIWREDMVYTVQDNIKPLLVNLSNPLGLIPVLYGLKNEGQDKYQQDYQHLLTIWRNSDLDHLPSFSPRPFKRIERSDALQHLVDGFKQAANGKTPPIQVIQGIAGVGKTQLAISYAHQYHKEKNGQGFVCWIEADEMNLPSQWSRLGTALELNLQGLSAQEQLQEIRIALSKKENWLIILDNVQDKEALEGFLPQEQLPTQQVLIASRSLNWSGYPVYNLTPFTSKESQIYFENILNKSLHEGSDALAAEFGHLPLALSHITAYMNERNMTAQAYHKIYKKKGVVLLAKSIKDESSKAKYTDTVVSAYQSSIDQLTKKSPQAAKFLKICAYLDLEHIEQELLQSLLKIDEEMYHECNKAIAKCGLLIGKENTLHVRFFVQTVIRYIQSRGDVFAKRLKPIAEALIALHTNTKDPKKRHIVELHLETLVNHVRSFAEAENAAPDRVDCLTQLKQALAEKTAAEQAQKLLAEQAAKAEQAEKWKAEEAEKRRVAEEKKEDEEKMEGRIKNYSPLLKLAAAPVRAFWESADRTPRQVAQFLRLVIEGEQDQAEAILKVTPNLVLQSGKVIDLSKRQFECITAFQYAVWARDWHMWTMLLKYLSKEEAALQLRALEKYGTEHGTHFDFKPLIRAYETLEQNWDNWKAEEEKRDIHWVKQIGKELFLVPTHVANEYSRPDNSFHLSPDFTQAVLPRKRGQQDKEWYDQALGREWSWVRERDSATHTWSLKIRYKANNNDYKAQIDKHAVQRLEETREQQLKDLRVDLYQNKAVLNGENRSCTQNAMKKLSSISPSNIPHSLGSASEPELSNLSTSSFSSIHSSSSVSSSSALFDRGFFRPSPQKNNNFDEKTAEELQMKLSELTAQRDALLDLKQKGRGSHRSKLEKMYDELSAKITDIDREIRVMLDPGDGSSPQQLLPLQSGSGAGFDS